MPFYEAIILARCGHPKSTSGLLKAMASAILNEGGSVRDMKILGDRVLGVPVKDKEGNKYVVGRYLQVNHLRALVS